MIRVTGKSFAFIRDRLLNRTVEDAKAEKLSAEARLTDAKAVGVGQQATASAKSTRDVAVAEYNEKQTLAMERLRELGIDFTARTDRDGRLKIVVTKKRD